MVLDYDIEKERALKTIERLTLKILYNECKNEIDLNNLSQELDKLYNKY